jgi:hypothetical protein
MRELNAHYHGVFRFIFENVVNNAEAVGIGRDCSVGIVTGYGLDGRLSIHGRGKIFLFSTASQPAS